MTSKRFKLSMMSQYGSYSGVSDEDKEYTSDEIVDLLNQLNEENEQLKQEAEEYNEDAMSYQTLYEQQLEKNKKINQLIKKIEDNLNKYELVNRLEYEDWKKEIWED